MSLSQTPLRAVVVGAGLGGTLSINALVASDRFDLVGVADVSLDSLRRFEDRIAGVETNVDYQALFDSVRPDVVCVSTYAPSHAEITKAAVESGARGLLVEKPLGDTIAAGRQVLDVTLAAKVPFVVPHGLMAQAASLDIIRRVRGGEIGRLHLVEIESAEWDIINAGIHWIQFFLALTSPDDVRTVLTAADTSSRTFRDGMQVETDSITLATTDRGVRLVLQTGDYIKVDRGGALCAMRIIGTEGMIEYGAWENHFTLLVSGETKREITPSILPAAGHQYHLEHLADLVESGTLDYEIPLTSLKALEVVDAAYLSHRTCSQITLPMDGSVPDACVREGDWDPGRPYSGIGGGRNGREL